MMDENDEASSASGARAVASEGGEVRERVEIGGWGEFCFLYCCY